MDDISDEHFDASMGATEAAELASLATFVASSANFLHREQQF
jgi:hypothetical protein